MSRSSMSAGLMKDIAFSDNFLFLSFERMSLSLLMSWPLNCWQLWYLTAHRTKASGVKLRICYQRLCRTATSLLWGNTFSGSFLLWLVIVKIWQLGFSPKRCNCGVLAFMYMFLSLYAAPLLSCVIMCVVCSAWSNVPGEFWIRDFIVKVWRSWILLLVFPLTM